jgi:hypothetical protein
MSCEYCSIFTFFAFMSCTCSVSVSTTVTQVPQAAVGSEDFRLTFWIYFFSFIPRIPMWHHESFSFRLFLFRFSPFPSLNCYVFCFPPCLFISFCLLSFLCRFHCVPLSLTFCVFLISLSRLLTYAPSDHFHSWF